MSLWQFWIDRGGTFTDVIARGPDGRLLQTKLLSENPEQYQDAAIAGMRLVLGLENDVPLAPDTIAAVKMGTTVGTNALLTHAGEPTLLVVSEGFADALEIGDQARPDIFALDIRKPAPLYARVVEATERVDAGGKVLTPLCKDALQAALARARDEGFNACAIAFLHSWKNPEHELAAGNLARKLGFNQVTLSHQASPLIKFVPRAETAVLDATLSPPLGRYVEQVAQALPGDAHLEFMQSNGGLVAAGEFQGKDSVLSGPAGGLIGMAKVGRAAGFERLIGFDMGGTSTDVSLYAGEFERSLDTHIAGHRIRVPMLAVHTVAAGGGSLLKFDGSRLLAGPESAGSVPGPTCYRRGGPLAVTDANLLLGRIQADHFPAVFGPGGNQTLDKEAVQHAFEELAGEVNTALGLDYTPERLAEGFLEIAVEHMADAIRHITLARGVNPADYTLVSFGGAGGQHACAVADRLGIGQVLISPFASVLSAYGIGLAERRELRLEAVEQPLPFPSGGGIEGEGAASTSLSAPVLPPFPYPNPPPEGEGVKRRALLRYAGSDTVLPVRLGEPEAMAAAFHAQHRQRFGFADPGRELICVALETEIISGGGEAEPAPTQHDTPAMPAEMRRVFMAGAWREAPLWQSSDVCPGQIIQGPALLVEPGSTLVLEPGWRVEKTPRGDLLLTASERRMRRPDPTRPDPAWLTLFNRRFMSIAEDMGRVLQNTARSVNIRERLDFSCALFDQSGNLIANAPHIPVHLGSMGNSVRAILARFAGNMAPADAYLINSPYAGGTHLPDITVVMPVFGDDGLRYFTAARAHHADVGGIAPGSMPAASRHIDEEGCRSDGMLLVREGRLLEQDVRDWLGGVGLGTRGDQRGLPLSQRGNEGDLSKDGACASVAQSPQPPFEKGGSQGARNPGQNLADLQAQVAACHLGARLLHQLENEVGAEAVPAYMGFVQDNAEAAVKRLLQRLHGGDFVQPLDDGSQVQVRVEIDAGAQEACIDFAGTSPQQPGNLNAPASIAHSAVLYVFRTLLSAHGMSASLTPSPSPQGRGELQASRSDVASMEDIPLNAGVLRPLKIRLPPGSLLNPVYPAAVVAGNVETSQAIVDALYGALGALAASQGTMNNLSFGDAEHQYYETVCGGTGAGPGFNGASGVHSHMTNSRLTDPEVLEHALPLRVERFGLRRGSGGNGRWQGGEGVVRRLRFLAPMHGNLIASRRLVPPHGLAGGKAGLCGRQWIERADGTREILPGMTAFQMAEGDVLHLETPGGGGYRKEAGL